MKRFGVIIAPFPFSPSTPSSCRCSLLGKEAGEERRHWPQLLQLMKFCFSICSKGGGGADELCQERWGAGMLNPLPGLCRNVMDHSMQHLFSKPVSALLLSPNCNLLLLSISTLPARTGRVSSQRPGADRALASVTPPLPLIPVSLLHSSLHLELGAGGDGTATLILGESRGCLFLKGVVGEDAGTSTPGLGHRISPRVHPSCLSSTT